MVTMRGLSNQSKSRVSVLNLFALLSFKLSQKEKMQCTRSGGKERSFLRTISESCWSEACKDSNCIRAPSLEGIRELFAMSLDNGDWSSIPKLSLLRFCGVFKDSKN